MSRILASFARWWGSANAGNVNRDVVAQGSVAQCELYKLVNMEGGELIDLMNSSHTIDHIYDVIREKVRPFLYNEGRGKYVAISEVTKYRKGCKITQMPSKNLHKCRYKDTKQFQGSQNTFGESSEMKWVCWDLDKRGTVGETILHLCLLLATPVHLNLAKNLLHVFPNLIYDFYTGDTYYGETVLHMAVANEDPVMVKLLLESKADVNQRCCGEFFCPDDQKQGRRECSEHEWFDVPKRTNYHGLVYLGEHPLAWAACLSQEACVRMIHSRGADLDARDSNGNTVFHLMVIRDNKPMLDTLLKLAKDNSHLTRQNHQLLTPLTLAAKLARRSMYEHILTIQRQPKWIYGDVMCAAYPLKYIDSISANGEINRKSALRMIVYGNEEGHLEMMHGLVVNLLQEKWDKFVRRRFFRRFIFFILYFIASCTAFGLRPGTDHKPTIVQENITTNGKLEVINKTIIDPCYLLKPYTTKDVVRMVFEGGLLLSALIYTGFALKELNHQGRHVFFNTLAGAPAKLLFHVSCICVILMLPGRAACAYEYEDNLTILVILCTAPYFLFFCRGFHIIGPFVVMIYKMIKGDLLRFFTIYAIFVVGFSQAMYIIFGVHTPFSAMYIIFGGIEGHFFSNWLESMMALFIMSLGEFGDIYDSFTETRHSGMAKFVFVLYMILVTLLLVNMLIAMMGNTYQLINNIQKEWFRQWAKIVLVFEQSVTKKHRIEYQMRYSEDAGPDPDADPTPDTNGPDDPTKPRKPKLPNDRVYVVRWQLSPAEKKEQDEKLAEEWERGKKLIAQKSPSKKKKPHMNIAEQNNIHHPKRYVELGNGT